MNHNLPSDSLLEIALKNGEGTIVKNGALLLPPVKEPVEVQQTNLLYVTLKQKKL